MGSVIVVGGGMLGVSTAWRLAEAGLETTLIESGDIGGGATRASFAWINSSRKSPLPYHQLNVAGMNYYRRLQAELDSPRWLHFNGRIEWDASPDGEALLRAKTSKLADWEYGSQMLPISELKNLERDLVAPNHLQEFAYYPQEGCISPLEMLGDIALRAKDLGATFRTQTQVSDLILQGNRVQGIVTTSGERLMADTVVLCTGAVAPDLLSKVGFDLPMAPTRGLVAVTSPSTSGLMAVVNTDNLMMRPDGAGRAMIRHYDFDNMLASDTSESPAPAFLDGLLDRAVEVLPALSPTRIEAARITIRPIPADGKPVVGPVPTADGLYLMVCHSGVTMGPMLGHIAAREISTNYKDPVLADFRPDRKFAAPNQPIKENQVPGENDPQAPQSQQKAHRSNYSDCTRWPISGTTAPTND